MGTRRPAWPNDSASTLLYKWKARQLEHAGPVASKLEDRVKQLEAELLRVTRERDVLKKALTIFGRNV